jgi:hypothetical protein
LTRRGLIEGSPLRVDPPAAGFGLDSGSAQATIWQLPPALISSSVGTKVIIAASSKVTTRPTRK